LIKIVSGRGIAEIIILFAMVMILGFTIAVAALATSKVSLISNSLASPQFTLFAYILDAVIFGVLLLIALRRHHSKTLLFRTLEFIIIAFTSFFFFLVLYAMIIPPSVSYTAALPLSITNALALPGSVNLLGPYVLAFVSAIVLITAKELHPRIKDLATMVSSMGIGILLGINFPFVYAMLILAIVAFYDYITIFMTKVVVEFDKALIAMDISFLISVSDIEAVSPRAFGQKDEERYEEYLIRTHQADDPKFKKILKEGKLPVLSQVSLGEGDLSLPLMVAISAYYTYLSYSFAGIVMLGALAGVIVTMLLLKRYKKPLPAIPLLFCFMSIAAAFAYLYIGKAVGYGSVVLVIAGIAIMLLTVRYLHKEVVVEKANRMKEKNAKKEKTG
jgi:presenilin-like A22 family membrane protease